MSILPRRAEPDGAEQMPTIRRRTTAEFSRIPLRDKIPASNPRGQPPYRSFPRSRIRENSARRLGVRILPRRAEPDGAEQMPTIRRRTTAEFSRIPLRDKIPATERRGRRSQSLSLGAEGATNSCGALPAADQFVRQVRPQNQDRNGKVAGPFPFAVVAPPGP